MNTDEIHKCIDRLLNADTTYSNCQKLASLIVISDYITRNINSSTKDDFRDAGRELSDILPSHENYCETKTNFQLKKTGKEPVIEALICVCNEVQDYIHSLYSCTSMPEERVVLENFIDNLTLF